MITADPQQRVSTLHSIIAILDRTASPEDRDLLRAFAPVVYERHARFAGAEAVARGARRARFGGNFRFVARTMPPAFQLYKGLPGLHVSSATPTTPKTAADGRDAARSRSSKPTRPTRRSSSRA